MARAFSYIGKAQIRAAEARGRDAYERGHPYVGTNDMHWRRGWKAAQAARRKQTVVVNNDDPDRRAMLQRAEMMKRGGGGRWSVTGM